MSFYKELIHEMNKHDIKYLVFGGFAVNYYGFSRYTADIDLWIDSSEENMDRLKEALIALRFEISNAADEFFAKRSIMLRLSDGAEKADLLLKINIPATFSECFSRAVVSESPLGKMYIISYEDLVDEKILSKRPKDLYDIQQLKIIRKE